MGTSFGSRLRAPKRPTSVEPLETRQLFTANVLIGGADDLSFLANSTSTVDISYSAGAYTITDNAEVINVTNNGTGVVTGNGTNTITVTNTTSLDIDANGTESSLILISNAHPTTLHDSVGGYGFFQIGFSTAQGILGQVTIGSTAAPWTMAFDNQSDSTGRSVTVASGSITGLTPAAVDISGANLGGLYLFMGSGADTTTVTGTSTSTSLQGNTLGDTVNVQATNSGKSLIVAGSQAETINVGNSGSVQSIQGTLAITNSNASTSVNIDDSADNVGRNVTVGTSAITGLAPVTISRSSSNGALTLRGGSGGNTFTFNGSPASTTLYSGSGADTVYVRSIASSRPLTVHGQNGADSVTVGSAGHLLNGVLGAVTVDNTSGSTALSLDDASSSSTVNPTITATQVTGFAPNAINFSNLSALSLSGGSGNNTFTVDNNGVAAFSTSIVGGGGADTFTLSGASNLNGGTLNGGGGSNTLDYTNYVNASFTVDLVGGTATGTGGISNIQLVTPNRPPVATNDSYATNEDTDLIRNAAAGVLANDTDADNDSISATLLTGPSHGSLVFHPDGSFTYSPDGDYHGPDSFTYQANDGHATSNTATVSLTVSAVNDAPVAVADSFTVAEDGTHTVSAPGLLANDTDIDGDSLSATLVGGPSHGSLTLNADGSYVYSPDVNYHGSDSFTYKVNDGHADGNTATVSVTVTAVNDAPVAVDDGYTTAEGVALTVSAAGLLGNDSDVDGDTLSATLIGGPAHGTLTLNADGSFVYTPDAMYAGMDQFTYKASDGVALSGVATVDLTVSHTNHAPVAAADAFNTTKETPLTVTAGVGLLANDSDVDGDTLAATLAGGPSHGALTLNPDGSFTYAPEAGFSGVDSFTYFAADDDEQSAPATVTLNVSRVTQTPATAVNGAHIVPLATNLSPFAGSHADVHSAEVEALYHAVLGRDATTDEVNAWTTRLTRPNGLKKAASTLLRSEEYQRNVVASYYRTFLGREGSDQEIGGWVSRLQAGTTEEKVVLSLLSSAEYAELHGDGSGYVQSLYQNILSRDASDQEVASGMRRMNMNSVASRRTAARKVIRSSEAVEGAITSYFTAALGRSGDSTEVASLARSSRGGTAGLKRAAQRLLSSTEFMDKAADSVG